MRNLVFGFWLCVLLMACAIHKPDLKHPVVSKAPTNAQQLAKLYQWTFLDRDTLCVYSAQDLEDPKFKFKGKKLDSLQLMLFPEGLIEDVDEIRPVYACFRFKIDKFNWGLITRVAGEYSSTRIKLFVYNLHADSIYFHRELAEDFGDAGDVFLKRSWLYKNADETIGCLFREDRMYYNSMDDPADTSVDRSTSYLRSVILQDNLETITDSIYIRKFK